MARLLFVVSWFLCASAFADDPPKHRASTTTKRKRAVKRPAPPKAEDASPTLRPATPGNVPPGAQLGPNRTIEAPRAPGPDSSPGRVTEPARDVAPRRDADRGNVQPPYPTGPDPGRNMQPATGFNPSSQPIVP